MRPGGPILLGLGLELVAVFGASLVMVRRITRPLTAPPRAADRAGRGDGDARASVGGAAELRRVAEAFNAMQAAIGAFAAERARVVAALGHDLRRPITSLRIGTEMLDDEAAREPMIRTLEEMGVMADGLLRWGRGGAEAEQATAMDLARLLREAAAEGDPDAPMRNDGPQSLTLRARPVALRRAFANLADNARRHAGGGRVRLSAADGLATVAVEDDGPGISEDTWRRPSSPFGAASPRARSRRGAPSSASRSPATPSAPMVERWRSRTAPRAASAPSPPCRWTAGRTRFPCEGPGDRGRQGRTPRGGPGTPEGRRITGGGRGSVSPQALGHGPAPCRPPPPSPIRRSPEENPSGAPIRGRSARSELPAAGGTPPGAHPSRAPPRAASAG